ncbi:MAG: UDP-glucose 4-epimerase GalE [Polyangia bacterium]
MILVTGGAGFVGSHFVRAACDAGLGVVVLDDLSGGARLPLPLPDSVRFVSGDIGDSALLAELCRAHGVTQLVHFAGKIQVGESVRLPAMYFDVNLVRSLRLLDAVLAAGVRQVVFSSTAAVYGAPERVPIPETAVTEPVNPYGRSKLAFEWVLRSYETAHGLRWAAPRYFNAAGAHKDGTLREQHEPETHLIPLVLDAGLGRRPPLTVFGTDYPTPDGTCVRDYIHVADLADAHLLALERLAAGEVVGPLNLGTGRGYSVREVLELSAEVLGRPVPHAFGPRREGDPPELVADPGRAEQKLRWQARRSDLRVLLEDALRSRRDAG